MSSEKLLPRNFNLWHENAAKTEKCRLKRSTKTLAVNDFELMSQSEVKSVRLCLQVIMKIVHFFKPFTLLP